MDYINVNGNKLINHPYRLYLWQVDGKSMIEPVYVEISLTNKCNYKCSFCALDFAQFGNKIECNWEASRVARNMNTARVRAVMFGGEGEPTLHKNFNEIVRAFYDNSSIDLALTTNGSRINKNFLESQASMFKWIKISLNAVRLESFMKIHQVEEKMYSNIISNFKDIKEYKSTKPKVTIGAQMVLNKDNCNEIEEAIVFCREHKLDYLIIKPYSQHPSSVDAGVDDFEYRNYIASMYILKSKYDIEGFKVYIRSCEDEITYDKCRAVPYFWAYVDSYGNVNGCSTFLDNKDFIMGNLHKESFSSIWQGEKRQALMKKMETFDCKRECRKNCRMNSVNKFMQEFDNPGEHGNFI